MRPMSDNEQRILALIATEGPLSKRDLADRGTMAWATVVKYVNRLESEEVLARVGTSPRDQHLGKNAYLYDLAGSAPQFVGIDVEYQITRLAVVDLRRQIQWSTSLPTPQLNGMNEMVAFLTETITVGIPDIISVAGIGIGMPRWLVTGEPDPFAALGARLTVDLGVRVSVENNIRAYTLYKEPLLQESAFLVVSVRNGIGAGIVFNGTLHRGETGLAGEIGHITVRDDGEQCRCGKRGCLETVVNQRILSEAYGTLTGEVESEERLAGLFSRAAGKDVAAAAILENAAEPLGRALATLILVLDIQSIYIVGLFGKDGGVWLEPLRRVIRRFVDPGLTFSLHYRELDNEGYLLGAALLVARDYLDYSVLGTNGRKT